MKLYKSLSTLLKDYRQWRGVTQEAFAESIGVSVRELRNWETDRRRVRIENLHDLSEFTGIPMQVCVALNADQPIWYSLPIKRFAYTSHEMKYLSSPELFKLLEKSDTNDSISYAPITNDRHIKMILSCHQDIYGNEKPLQRDVIKKASRILPDMNFIIIDCWGHYVAHMVCLPIKKEEYEQIKKKKFEGCLTAESINDIIALHEGVFFFYSSYAVSTYVAPLMIIKTLESLDEIEQKEGFLVACYSATNEGKEHLRNLGMRIAVRNAGEIEYPDANDVPILYELELSRLMETYRLYGILGCTIEDYHRKAWADNLTGEPKQEKLPKYGPLIDDDPLIDDRIENEACLNPQCMLHCKIGKGNIVFNGTYRTKGGVHVNRFLCKACRKVFCSRAGSIFYDLRSPQEKVLKALMLLAKGMSLRGVAKVLGVKHQTVLHWLKVASEQSGKIDSMLMKELKVSQVELDTLWTSVKSNSLRQRATQWRKLNTSHGTDLRI